MKSQGLVFLLTLLVITILAVSTMYGIDGQPYAMCAFFAGIVGIAVRQNRSAVAAIAVGTRRTVGTIENGALVFEPVWISSTEHLDRCDSVWDSASWPQRLLGRYQLPADMPQVIGPTPSVRVPLVFSAVGRLELEAGELRFRASTNAFKAPAQWHALGLDDSLRFELSMETIAKVALIRHKPRPMRMFGLDWIHLVGEAEQGSFDILLSMGGLGIRAWTLRSNTRAIFAALEREG